MEDRNTYLLGQQFQMTFTQESDCCDLGDGQFLKIQTENGGGGDFFVIETKQLDWPATKRGPLQNVANRHESGKIYEGVHFKLQEQGEQLKKSMP